MKKHILCAALLCAAGFANADLVARNGAGDELRLMAAPCTNPAILAQIKPEFHAQFQRGQATVGGKAIPACWIDNGEGQYIVFFPEAASGYPVQGFVNEPGA